MYHESHTAVTAFKCADLIISHQRADVKDSCWNSYTSGYSTVALRVARRQITERASSRSRYSFLTKQNHTTHTHLRRFGSLTPVALLYVGGYVLCAGMENPSPSLRNFEEWYRKDNLLRRPCLAGVLRGRSIVGTSTATSDRSRAPPHPARCVGLTSMRFTESCRSEMRSVSTGVVEEAPDLLSILNSLSLAIADILMCGGA